MKEIGTAPVYALDEKLCQDCANFSPRLFHHVLYGHQDVQSRDLRIVCDHYDLCENVLKDVKRKVVENP